MKNTLIVLIFCILFALLCGTAAAGESDHSFGITLYGAYHWIDKRDYEDGPEAGARLELFLGPRWSVELGVGHARFERVSTGIKKNSTPYMLNAVYNLTESGTIVPYLTAGVGGDYTERKGLTGPDAGLGARIFLTDGIVLKPEARYIYLFRGREDVVVSLGLSFLFGRTSATRTEAKEEPAPARPEPRPEPAPAPKPAVADSDRDGVADSEDKCPGTQSGLRVDAKGCPADSDRDGVPDHLDTCPGSPSGSRVDAAGCVLSITLKVNFDPGRSVVKQAYLGEIERFAEFLKQYPDVTAEIQGHTDNRGDRKMNQALSEARAKAVRDAVVSRFGIAPERLTAKGYGPDQPVATNDTAEGREKNRRVEAVLSK